MKRATPGLMPGVATTRKTLSWEPLVYSLRGISPQLTTHERIGIRPDVFSIVDVVDVIVRVGRGAHTGLASIGARIPIQIARVHRRIVWTRLVLGVLGECRRRQQSSQRHNGDSRFHDVSLSSLSDVVNSCFCLILHRTVLL